MTNSEMKKAIAAFMFKTQEPVSPREIALEIGVDTTKSRHYDVIRSMTEANDAVKLDTGRYVISDSGIVKYGLRAGIEKGGAVDATLNHIEKEDKKSALTQTEKTPIEAVEPAKTAEESPLEQNKTAIKNATGIEMQATNNDGTTFIPLGVPTAPLTEKMQVWKILEDAGDKIIALQPTKKEITNIDIKLNLLRNELPQLLNGAIATLLLQIADDLEGK